MNARIACLAVLLGFVSAASAEKLVIRGSNTFGEELGPSLIQTYGKTGHKTSVDLESAGSASGFTALLAGECDIAASSRLASEDEERLARSRRIRLNFYTVGYYATAVIVNETNPVAKLTDAQVRDIFTGEIANWKKLGGPDAPIALFIRDPVSGTHLGFQELALERKPYAANATAFKTYAEIAKAVQDDPHAIGYVGMNLAELAGLRALAINGVRPTATAVNNQSYPYARQIRFYTVKGKESAAVREFIRFVWSKRGQDVLRDLGYVRRFEADQELMLPEGN